MEVSRRPEGKGHVSRSRRDATNKENVCPLEASHIAAEIGSGKSPLPPGFPRSPLQDITHILYPSNIWSDGEDPLTGHAHKKFKKENSRGLCAENESESKSVNWKGLRSCAQFRLQMTDNQAEEATEDKLDCVQILSKLPEKCGETCQIERPLGIYRDVPANNGSSALVFGTGAVNCEGEEKCRNKGRIETASCSHIEHAEMGVALKIAQKDEGAENEQRMTEFRGHSLERDENRAGKAHSAENSESGKADGSEVSYKNDDNTHKHILSSKETNYKRPGQSAQVKKRSTLSMLR